MTRERTARRAVVEGALSGAAELDRAGPRAGRGRGSSALELSQPLLDRGLAEPAVTAQPHVRDLAGSGLRPDPVGPHAQPLGDFLGGQLVAATHNLLKLHNHWIANTA